MNKQEFLKLLDLAGEFDEIVLYDGDDSIFKLSYYGQPTLNELWLKIEFDTTVEDLDG